MAILSSKEYAAKLSETVKEVEDRECYEANLMAMGKDSPYQIEEAFKEGKIIALKHIMDIYKAVKEHYSNMEGLTFNVIDVMLAEAAEEIMEDINEY
jgi:galactose-1-phosphate uridylyltransferase